MSLHIEAVSGVDNFHQLGSLWDDCCRATNNDSFFLSHAWFKCCLAGLPEGAEPVVLIVGDGAAVVGIVPLLSHKANWRVFPARLLTLMQNQDSPFADMVLPPADRAPVLTRVLEHLDKRPGWHLWSAAKVASTSPTAAALAGCLTGHPHLQVPGGRSPILDVDGSWDLYWKGQSQRFKKTVRNVTNRMERLGRIEIVDYAAHATAAECMDVFRAVAARSWKANLPVSLTRNAGIVRFFEALTSTLQAQGQLALWVLRVDGVPIATEYHVRDGDTVYALRSDFDDEHRDASPGAHLNAFIAQTYFESDVRVYDMGLGESEYKQRWATATREFTTFWLFKRAPYAQALYGMERSAVPRLRRMREWWRTRSHSLDSSAGHRA